MTERMEEVKLQDGTLIRHKVAGYEGRIDGVTGIKSCFTTAGKLLERPNTGQIFQYRVAVEGETIRRIAPPQDLEILEGVEEVVCLNCHATFRSKPGLEDKPGGRCQCGAWICPSCLACRSTATESEKNARPACVKERKRFIKKLAVENKKKRV